MNESDSTLEGLAAHGRRDRVRQSRLDETARACMAAMVTEGWRPTETSREHCAYDAAYALEAERTRRLQEEGWV